MPPPEKKTVTVPLGGKLEEGIDPKLLGRAGQFMARAESVQYDKHGLVSKCPGNEAIAYTTRSISAVLKNLSSVHHMGSESGRMTVAGYTELAGESGYGEYYQAYSYHDDDDEFQYMGGWAPVSQDVYKTSHGSENLEDPDGTVWLGYQWLVWTDSGSVWISVKEVSTGTVTYHQEFPTAAATAYQEIKVVPVDTKVHVFVRDGQNVRFFRLNPVFPYSPIDDFGNLPAVLLLAARPLWDVCKIDTGGNQYSAIVWNDNALGQLEVRYMVDNYAGGAYAFTWSTGLTCRECVTIAQVNDYNAPEDHFLASYVNNANELRYITRLASDPTVPRTNDTLIANLAGGGDDQDCLQLAASSDHCSGWVDGDANQVAVVWAGVQELDSAVGVPANRVAHRHVRTWRLILNSGGIGAGGVYGPGGEDYTWWNHELMSNAWMHGGRSHVWMSHYSPDAGEESQRGATLATHSQRDGNPTFNNRQQGLASLHKDRLVAKAFTGLPGITTDTDGNFWWACATKEGSNQYSAAINKLSFQRQGMTGVNSGPDVLHAGGYMHCDDGAMGPHGFFYYPQPQRQVGDGRTSANVLDHNLAGIGLYDDVAYTYVFTYEWVDKNGQWHVSEPSPGTTTVPPVVPPPGAGVVSQVQMDITSHIPGWWQREFGHVKICIYRNTTQSGGVAATEPYHLVGMVDNDPSVTAVAFTDNMTDNTARTQPLLYTTGDVIANTATPPVWHLADHKNRTWFISDEDKHDIWYSKEKAQGVAAEFSSLLRVRMNEPAVALASTPEALLVFSEKNIYAIYGEGPGDTGVGSFYLPRKIATGTGCSNSRSVRETAIGVVFQDGDDLYVIDGKLSPQKISGAVDDQLEGQTILSVIDDTDENRLKFIYNDGVGKYLVYDYEHDRWAEWSYRSDPAEDVTHGCLWNGDVYTMTDAFTLLKDTPGTYALDGYATGPSMILETPWIDMGALTGLQRTWWIQLLGEWVSAHNMVVYVYFDYNKSAVISPIPISKTFDCTTQKAPYILRMKPSHQKSKVIKVAIQEIPGGSVSRSVDLTAVEFICGFKTPKSTGFALSG